MSEEDGFIFSIVSDPNNDALRLIYADFLEEKGDPRAEFIRAQCTLANLPLRHPDRPALARTVWELLDAHGSEWTQHYAGWMRRCRFRRGFIESAVLTLDGFLHHLWTLRRSTPVQHISLDLTGVSIPPAVLNRIAEGTARKNKIVPIIVTEQGSLLVACANVAACDQTRLEWSVHGEVELVEASTTQIVEVLDRHYGPETAYYPLSLRPSNDLDLTLEEEDPDADFQFGVHHSDLSDASTTQDGALMKTLVEGYIREGLWHGASIIIFQPLVYSIRISYQVGSWRSGCTKLPKRLSNQIISAISHITVPNTDPEDPTHFGWLPFDDLGLIRRLRVRMIPGNRGTTVILHR